MVCLGDLERVEWRTVKGPQNLNDIHVQCCRPEAHNIKVKLSQYMPWHTILYLEKNYKNILFIYLFNSQTKKLQK
jgi:hypothetical protein